MSTTYPIRPIRPANSVGASTQLWVGLEDASQTWTEGAALSRDAATGEIKEYIVDGDDLLGFASAAATGTTGAQVLFYPAVTSMRFQGALVGSSAADYTSLAADIWTDYGLAYDATETVWYIDQGEETNVRVFVTRFIEPVGTVNCLVEFVMLLDGTVFSSAQLA
jgi:hypothetical protein